MHYAPLNYHPDAHIRSGGCLDRSCRLRGSYELDSYRRLGLWFERHIEELGKECPTLGGWRCSIHENPRRLILGNPLPFADPLGKWVQNSLSWRLQRNNETKKERDVQSRRARGAGRMTEQELERLRQVADRLTDANQEALEAIERMLVHEGEGGFVDDEAETAWEAEHLEATLVDVRDILGGASEDVRSLLEDSGE